MKVWQDHRGKASSARIAALAGVAVLGAITVNWSFGEGPEPTFEIMAALLTPGGWALWQRVQAPAEHPQGGA